jgi:hypothetical protein
MIVVVTNVIINSVVFLNGGSSPPRCHAGFEPHVNHLIVSHQLMFVRTA